MNNPLESSLRRFFKRLNDAFGLYLIIERCLGDRFSAAKNQIDEMSQVPSDIRPVLGTWVSLYVEDLTTVAPCPRRWVKTGEEFEALDQEFLQAIQDVLYRTAGWSFLHVYEGFETYLKDVSAAYLAANPAEADARMLQKFMDADDSRTTPKAIDDWRQFVGYGYRGEDNKELFKLLRSFCGAIEQHEAQNQGGIDLKPWYRAASKVRHAITHSDFILKTEVLNRWTKSEQRVIQSVFPGESAETGWRVCMTTPSLKFHVTTLGEYAFLIFKLLSDQKNYDTSSFESYAHTVN